MWNILLNILFSLMTVSGMLCLLFFQLIVKIEQEVIFRQIQFTIYDLSSGLQSLIIVHPEIKSQIIDYITIDNQTLQELYEIDNTINSHNQILVSKAIIWIIVLWISCIFLIVLVKLYLRDRVILRNLFIYNLFILMTITITDIIFIYTVVRSYQFLDGTIVRNVIINKL